jgi:hypothetical protein
MEVCRICKKDFDTNDLLIEHLNKSICTTRELYNKTNVIKYIPNDIYNNIGLKTLINTYFSINNGYGSDKKIALELLENVIKILNEFEIDYFAISGTLLGIIRHNDIIPWDDDIDLIVNISIKNKINDIYEKYKNVIHLINYGNLLKICFIDKAHPIINKDLFKNASVGEIKRYNYPFIDLFIMEEKEEELIFFEKTWVKNNFYPAKIYNLFNININIPNNSEYFLNINYGMNWNTVLVSSSWCHKLERGTKRKFKILLDDYNNIINNL